MEQKVVKLEIGKVLAVVITIIVIAVVASFALRSTYFKGTGYITSGVPEGETYTVDQTQIEENNEYEEYTVDQTQIEENNEYEEYSIQQSQIEENNEYEENVVEIDTTSIEQTEYEQNYTIENAEIKQDTYEENKEIEIPKESYEQLEASAKILNEALYKTKIEYIQSHLKDYIEKIEKLKEVKDYKVFLSELDAIALDIEKFLSDKEFMASSDYDAIAKDLNIVMANLDAAKKAIEEVSDANPLPA